MKSTPIDAEIVERKIKESKLKKVGRASIRENDYNLAAGRYKPQITEATPKEDPSELIRDTMKIETEITTGLGKLLKDIEAAS